MGELSEVERDAVQAARVLASMADHPASKETGGERVFWELAQAGGHVLSDPWPPAPRGVPRDRLAHRERRVHGDPGE